MVSCINSLCHQSYSVHVIVAALPETCDFYLTLMLFYCGITFLQFMNGTRIGKIPLLVAGLFSVHFWQVLIIWNLQFVMPKQWSKKNIINSELYALSKKHGNSTGSSASSDSVDNQQDASFHYDICTNPVDHLIQCDRCLIWYCCTCGGASEHLITVLDEFKELNWFCQKCDAIAIEAIRAFNPTIPTQSSDILPAVTGAITTAIQSLQDALKSTIDDLVSAKLP